MRWWYYSTRDGYDSGDMRGNRMGKYANDFY